MALTGSYPRHLDEKNRLAIPKRLRTDLVENGSNEDSGSVYVAPGTEQSLALYSPAQFEGLAKRLADQSSSRLEVRNYLRLFYSQAERLDFDAQGRIRIPDRLVDFAKLTRNIILLGVHDHAEIWDQSLWENFFQMHGPQFDDFATRAFQ